MQPFFGQLNSQLNSSWGRGRGGGRGIPLGEPAPPPVMKQTRFRGVQWSLKLQAWRVMLWHDGQVAARTFCPASPACGQAAADSFIMGAHACCCTEEELGPGASR